MIEKLEKLLKNSAGFQTYWKHFSFFQVVKKERCYIIKIRYYMDFDKSYGVVIYVTKDGKIDYNNLSRNDLLKIIEVGVNIFINPDWYENGVVDKEVYNFWCELIKRCSDKLNQLVTARNKLIKKIRS